MAVVPHKGNQYRPHAIRRFGIATIVLMLFVSYGANNYVSAGDVLGQQMNVTSSGLLETVNEAREQNDLSDLRINPQLNKAAYAKAQDMLQKQYWAHVSPTGVQPWKWMNDVKYNYDKAGENLAKGFSSSGAVTAAWLASPDHRANVLNKSYEDVGFAVVEGELLGKETILVVSMYGEPAELGSIAGTSIEFHGAEQANGTLAVLGERVQNLPAIGIFSVMILLAAASLGLAAHAYRNKLPKNLRMTWYRHHGIYKAIGLTSLSVVVVFMYTGGQI
jgi:hypothetical protein